MDVQAVQNFFSAIPLDWIVFAVIAIVAGAEALRAGVGKHVALALALPLSAVFYGALSGTYVLGPLAARLDAPIMQAAIVAVLAVAFGALIGRMMGSGMSATLLQSALAGLAVAVVVVLTWTMLTPLTALWQPGAAFQSIFGESYRLFWFLFVYAALAYARM